MTVCEAALESRENYDMQTVECSQWSFSAETESVALNYRIVLVIISCHFGFCRNI